MTTLQRLDILYAALGTQRILERHKIADLKHSWSAKIRRHFTMLRAEFSIVRAVLGQQNNAFTLNLSNKNVMKCATFFLD